MPDHKFEPFQRVLVRDYDNSKWRADLFSNYQPDEKYRYVTMASGYMQCIPYTDETAHLLGTTRPYEPPLPPVQYELGQKVEVFQHGEWDKGLYIGCIPISLRHRVYTDKHGDGLFSYAEIRPLPDSAAH